MRFPIAVLLMVLAPLSCFSADPMIGQRVFVKEGAEAKIGDTVVDSKLIPFVATIEDVDGDLLWLGRAWVRKLDVMSAGEALEFYSEKIRQEPSNGTAWRQRGPVLFVKGDIDAALKDLNEAIRLSPDDATCR